MSSHAIIEPRVAVEALLVVEALVVETRIHVTRIVLHRPST